MFGGIATAVGTLIVVIFILYLTFACTKYLGKNMKVKSASKHMQLIDQLILGQESSVSIIKVGGRLYLIGTSGSQITILSEIEEDHLEEYTQEKEIKVPDFKEIMERIGNRKK